MLSHVTNRESNPALVTVAPAGIRFKFQCPCQGTSHWRRRHSDESESDSHGGPGSARTACGRRDHESPTRHHIRRSPRLPPRPATDGPGCRRWHRHGYRDGQLSVTVLDSTEPGPGPARQGRRAIDSQPDSDHPASGPAAAPPAPISVRLDASDFLTRDSDSGGAWARPDAASKTRHSDR